MINLLPKSQVSVSPMQNVRHLVIAMTTVILVIYIVSLFALFGFGYYLKVKAQDLTGQISNLTSQINKLSSKEAYIRQIYLREQAINKFVTTRVQPAPLLKTINIFGPSITISDWEYKGINVNKLGVVSSSHADLQEYLLLLKAGFTNLTVEKTTQKGDQWNSVLLLK